MFSFELVRNVGVTRVAGSQGEEGGGSLFNVALVDIAKAVSEASCLLLIFGGRFVCLMFSRFDDVHLIVLNEGEPIASNLIVHTGSEDLSDATRAAVFVCRRFA